MIRRAELLRLDFAKMLFDGGWAVGVDFDFDFDVDFDVSVDVAKERVLLDQTSHGFRSNRPRVEKGHVVGEVGGVAGDDGEVVLEGGGG